MGKKKEAKKRKNEEADDGKNKAKDEREDNTEDEEEDCFLIRLKDARRKKIAKKKEERRKKIEGEGQRRSMPRRSCLSTCHTLRLNLKLLIVILYFSTVFQGCINPCIPLYNRRVGCALCILHILHADSCACCLASIR